MSTLPLNFIPTQHSITRSRVKGQGRKEPLKKIVNSPAGGDAIHTELHGETKTNGVTVTFQVREVKKTARVKNEDTRHINRTRPSDILAAFKWCRYRRKLSYVIAENEK